MAGVIADHICRNDAYLKQTLAKMLNNKKYSNTVFLVNKKKFLVSSHIVGASSEVLDSLMTSHFQNSSDRKIKITDVKNKLSFELLLKYIYGVDINFTQTDIGVLCEALVLSENYKIAALSKELGSYLSELGGFQVDSVVALLNTAKKANLQDLYDKLTIFAYENTDAIVRHPSFIDLQCDVLLDLIPSDWFCTSEIEILSAVLAWHGDMYKSDKEVLEKKNEGVEEQDMRNANQSDTSDCETDVAESTEYLSLDEDDGKKECSDRKKLDLEIEALLMKNSHEKKKKTDEPSDLLKSFSDNILKSLLSHIRARQFSGFELMKAVKTDLFKKYKAYIADYKYFSESNEPRKRYYVEEHREVEEEVVPIVEYKVRNDVTMKFTIMWWGQSDEMYVSKEEIVLDNLKWKLCLKRTRDLYYDGAYGDYHYYHHNMFLKCTSVKQADWECSVQCRVKMISVDSNILSIETPPSPKNCATLTLATDNSCLSIDTITFEDYSSTYRNWVSAFQPNGTLTFQLYLKYIHRTK